MKSVYVYIFLIIALLLLFRNNRRLQEEIEGSKYFYMSNGLSVDMYNKMKNDGLSEETLKEFVKMEDRLFELERLSVCTQVSHTTEAIGISQNIRDRFIGYDFSYHGEHLRQVAHPTKLINRKIVCHIK
ncbi:hypothetical protein [Dishui Lake phycodnavirus 4]|nr:hypothetical protein [Dishui Lake phycodnavirus 4]